MSLRAVSRFRAPRGAAPRRVPLAGVLALLLPALLSCTEEGLIKPFIPDTVQVEAPRETLRPAEVMVLKARLTSTDVSITTEKVSWSSSNPAVATVDSSGLVTAVSRGQAVLGATVVTKDNRSLRGTTTLTVVGVQAVAVEGTPSSLTLGTSAQLTARLTLDAGAAAVPVIWSSSDPARVTVSGSGVVTGVAIGTATITATAERASGTALVRVVSNVAQLRAVPATATMVVQQTLQVAAVLTDAAGNVLTGQAVAWSSSSPSVATVSAAGLVTAVGPGTATITVTEPSTGRSATATVTVVPRVASAAIAPADPSVFQGQALQLTALFRDSTGALLTRATIWQVSSPQVATVGRATGLVTGVSPGTATVVAIDSLSGHAASTTVTVVVPVAAVTVSPPTSTLAIGGTQQLTASAVDAAGLPLTGRPVTWSSSNATVATVSAQGLVTAVAAGTATVTATVEGRMATAAITVNPPPVATVAVAPSSANLVVNAVQQFTASTFGTDGSVLTGRPVTWSSTNTAVATVSAAGLVTGVAQGSATIVATVEGKTGTAAVLVTAPPVATVSVSPAAATVTTGSVQSLTATLRDAAGVVLPGREVTWSSSDPALATVSASGLVTGVGVGAVVITATAEGKSGSAAVRVVSSVAQVRVAPPSPTMVVQQALQLSAVLTDSTGRVLTGQTVAWTIAPTTVATVSATGVVTAVAVGVATVTATEVSTGRSGSTNINVVPRVASAAIVPAGGSVFQGQTLQLAVTYLDGSGTPLTGRPTIWQSSSPDIAIIGRASGLVTGVAPGTATVVAIDSISGFAANTTVSVVAPVVTVAVTPSSSTLPIGATQQFTASAFDGNGGPLTGRPVLWSSTNASVATISAQGLVTAVAPGTATITAAVEGKTASATVTVSPPPVASVRVAPATASIVINAVQQFTASALDADGNVLTGRPVTWSSTNAAAATVSAAGLVTGVAQGSATIVATVEGKSATAAVVVTAPAVSSVTVSPSTASVITGATQPFTATLRDAAGVLLPGREVSWTTSGPEIATISSTGLLTAVAAGSVTVTATSEGKSGTATVLVTNPPVATVTVSPTSAAMLPGEQLSFTARATDAAGNVLTGRPVTWSAANPAVATITTAGRVTAVGAGSTTITATVEGRSGSAALTVSAPVSSVTISPASASLLVSAVQQLSATSRDSSGNVLQRRPVAWSSSNTAVASVSAQGLVSGIAPGSASITATVEGRTATAAITVALASVATVALDPSSGFMPISVGVPLEVTLRDVNGNVLTGRTVAWSSSDPQRGAVTTNGVVTAAGTASFTITATSEGRSAAATFEGRTGLRSGEERVVSNPTEGTWSYFAIHVPPGSTSLTASMSGGEGDPDLYVWRPGNSGEANCFPFLAGSVERCDFTNPASGVWLVGVRAYAAHSFTRLVVTVRP